VALNQAVKAAALSERQLVTGHVIMTPRFEYAWDDMTGQKTSSITLTVAIGPL
jgi:hypothetical protein